MGDLIDLQAWRGKLDTGKNGTKKNLRNLMLHLQNVAGLGTSIRYNELTGRIEWRGKSLEDHDIVDIRLLIEEAGFVPNTSDVWPAVDRHARKNSYDPVRDYLDGLAWDNTPRLDTWLQTYMGAPAQEILSVFGPKFLIGAVARIYRPGCQMDNALVFEGRQGAGKTTAVSALFGRKYMISGISDFKGKDASQALQGHWVAEIAELAALRRTDIENAKRFLTETIDQYRPTYGKAMVAQPRRCVFVGTTNEESYLRDPTGNRRFWPVPCGRVDVAAIARDRDQLWAEAVHRFRAGEKWWIDDHATLAHAEAAQADRAIEDPWGDVIDAWLDAPANLHRDFVTVPEILEHAIRKPTERQDKPDMDRVRNHLKKRGWTNGRMRVPGKDQSKGPRPRVWRRPAQQAPSGRSNPLQTGPHGPSWSTYSPSNSSS